MLIFKSNSCSKYPLPRLSLFLAGMQNELFEEKSKKASQKQNFDSQE